MANPYVALMMDQVVRQVVNANAGGATRSRHGAARPAWQDVAGMGSIPCHPVRKERGFRNEEGVDVPVLFVRLIFADLVTADSRHAFVWRDPWRGGKETWWFVDDKSTTPGGVLPVVDEELSYGVDCFEYVDS